MSLRKHFPPFFVQYNKKIKFFENLKRNRASLLIRGDVCLTSSVVKKLRINFSEIFWYALIRIFSPKRELSHIYLNSEFEKWKEQPYSERKFSIYFSEN